jgi:anti-sigma28 factor (negative regulator of flagellin synthesis)
MKIGLGTPDNLGQTQNTSQSAYVGQTSGSPQRIGSQQYGLDRVDVSSVAQTAASVLGTAGNQRAQQVGSLTQLYQSGQYSVDPVKLSSAIVDHEMDPTHANT